MEKCFLCSTAWILKCAYCGDKLRLHRVKQAKLVMFVCLTTRSQQHFLYIIKWDISGEWDGHGLFYCAEEMNIQKSQVSCLRDTYQTRDPQQMKQKFSSINSEAKQKICLAAVQIIMYLILFTFPVKVYSVRVNDLQMRSMQFYILRLSQSLVVSGTNAFLWP
jgi:hypothetical protein